MGVQHNYGTAGATGGGWAAQPGWLHPTYEERTHEPRWSWQNRSPKTLKDPTSFRNLWSFGCKVDGGDDLSYSALGGEVGHGFEPFSCDGDGTQSLKFLKGVCRDESNNVLSGVQLQAFRTSDDAFAGYGVLSREDGSYDLPTKFPGVAHYVVAYMPGSPDRAGTTVNTLVPTNIDGS